MRRRSAAYYPGDGVHLVSTKAEHLTGAPLKSSAQVAHPTTRPKPETTLNPRLASTCPTALAAASMSWHGRLDAPPAAGQITSRLYIEETSSADLLWPPARTRRHHRPAPNFPVRSGAASRACAATRTNRPCTYAAAEATALDGLDSLMRERTRRVQAPP